MIFDVFGNTNVLSDTPGVYEVPCTRGKSCIGRTGRAIATRIKTWIFPEKSNIILQFMKASIDL